MAKSSVWATHQDAHEALMGMPKAPEGLEKSLLPVNGNRPVIEREFWTRAPAKLRPGPEGFSYNPAAPKGEWGMTLIVGDDTGKRSGDITHLPTLSYFRFWADSDGKPTVQEAHRGDRVKSDKEWETLMAEAPKQRAKFEAMLEANPEL